MKFLSLTALLTLTIFGNIAMADQNVDLWGPIKINNWKDTPCIEGRLATEEDVKKGIAVFYIENSDNAKPIKIDLPLCAIHIDQETKKEIPVILIQAEKSQGQDLIGYRFLNGGNGIALLFEFKLLKKPNKKFK